MNTGVMVDHDSMPVSLDAARAKQFLRALRTRPFVAVVVEHGELKLYSKGLSSEQVAEHLDDVLDQLRAAS